MPRVHKIISERGYCSRRKAEELIKEGRVKVNGKVVSIGNKAAENDKIEVDGKVLKQQKKVYLMLNKPIKFITALKDARRDTVMDLIRVKEGIFPVGRLDYYTSGLLLLTNDGEFSNKVSHPRYNVKKTYLAELNKPITNEHIKRIEKGIRLEDGLTSPAKVRKLELNHAQITLHEGKNRIVRRIFDSLGYKVRALKRTKIGNLELGTLKPGKYRMLNPKDIEKIFQ